MPDKKILDKSKWPKIDPPDDVLKPVGEEPGPGDEDLPVLEENWMQEEGPRDPKGDE